MHVVRFYEHRSFNDAPFRFRFRYCIYLSIYLSIRLWFTIHPSIYSIASQSTQLNSTQHIKALSLPSRSLIITLYYYLLHPLSHIIQTLLLLLSSSSSSSLLLLSSSPLPLYSHINIILSLPPSRPSLWLSQTPISSPSPPFSPSPNSQLKKLNPKTHNPNPFPRKSSEPKPSNSHPQFLSLSQSPVSP